MKSPQFLNEPIEVTARLSGSRVTPETVQWQGITRTVVSTGRQWHQDNQTHVLVELHTGGRMEIILQPDLRWVVSRYWPPVQVA